MNRFDDGRFDERRAFFRSKSVGSVLENIKSAEDLTWDELADIFDVST